MATTKNKQRYRPYKEWPEEKKAKYRVRQWLTGRVHRRLFPKASVFTCCDCGKAQASEYHHNTYEVKWNVEALCKTCHRARHADESWKKAPVYRKVPGRLYFERVE